MVQSINIRGAEVDLAMGMPVPMDSALHNAPAAATAAVVTITADANRGTVLSQIFCSYDTTPTGGSVQVQDGSTVVFKQFIAAAGLNQISFDPPLVGTRNTALVVTLASGAGTVVGILTVNAHRQE